MHWLHRMAIRRKLILLAFLPCMFALLLVVVVFSRYDVALYRSMMVRELTVLATVLGNNSTAALAFNEPTTAAEMLSALKHQSHIVAGCLYDQNGRIFAAYTRPLATAHLPAQVKNRSARFEFDRLTIFQPIEMDGQSFGTIYLESDLTELTKRLRLSNVMVTVTLLFAVAVAVGLALQLQRYIAQPIIKLSAAAHAISRKQDYSQRVDTTTEDELGELTAAFNEMLAQIQIRDRTLADANAQLEQTVASRTAKLQAAVIDLEHFSYSITHDLRAPLRAIRGYSHLLLQECTNYVPANGRDYLQRIITGVERMDHLIVDVLDYSKAMRAEWVLAPVDADALLRGMCKTYDELQLPAVDIRIEGVLPAVMANQAGLTQCFSNLLHNAIKFVAAGVVPQVRVAAEVRGDRVRFWVIDNGIGISAEQHERIFEIFQRLNKTYEGTGIGLALVRKLIQRMGGQVGVESEPGHGSRFWIELIRANQS